MTPDGLDRKGGSEVLGTWIFLGLVLLGIGWLWISIKRTDEQTEKHRLEIDALIDRMGITKSTDRECNTAGYYRFITDDETQTVYINEGIEKAEFLSIPYERLLGVDIQEDLRETGMVKNAIKGTLLAGEIGGFWGSMVTETKVFSLKAVLRLKDQTPSEYVFKLIAFRCKPGSPLYNMALEFAVGVKADVDAILRRRKKAVRSHPAVPGHPVMPAPGTDDITEKLKKLKDLREQELISESEYTDKKAELLKKL